MSVLTWVLSLIDVMACACAGTLPPEYSNMTGLIDLDVHDNLLTGTLPAAYFTASAFTNNTFMEARCPCMGACGP